MNFLTKCAALGLFVALAGCGSKPPEKASAEARDTTAPVEAVELNAEEAALLAAPAPPPAPAEPVTPANYKKALDELEAEIAAEQ
ncbi:MAG: hypothetical protein R2834_16430 [Rhodothermales bacterium]